MRSVASCAVMLEWRDLARSNRVSISSLLAAISSKRAARDSRRDVDVIEACAIVRKDEGDAGCGVTDSVIVECTRINVSTISGSYIDPRLSWRILIASLSER